MDMRQTTPTLQLLKSYAINHNQRGMSQNIDYCLENLPIFLLDPGFKTRLAPDMKTK